MMLRMQWLPIKTQFKTKQKINGKRRTKKIALLFLVKQTKKLNL